MSQISLLSFAVLLGAVAAVVVVAAAAEMVAVAERRRTRALVNGHLWVAAWQ